MNTSDIIDALLFAADMADYVGQSHHAEEYGTTSKRVDSAIKLLELVGNDREMVRLLLAQFIAAIVD